MQLPHPSGYEHPKCLPVTRELVLKCYFSEFHHCFQLPLPQQRFWMLLFDPSHKLKGMYYINETSSPQRHIRVDGNSSLSLASSVYFLYLASSTLFSSSLNSCALMCLDESFFSDFWSSHCCKNINDKVGSSFAKLICNVLIL